MPEQLRDPMNSLLMELRGQRDAAQSALAAQSREIAKLREALKLAVGYAEGSIMYSTNDIIELKQRIARAALARDEVKP